MSMLEIINSRGTAGYKILAVILYLDLPCMEKTSDGKVIISSMSDLYSDLNINPTYFRNYLLFLENLGILSKVIFKYNYVSFVVNKPPMFDYAE